MFNRVKLGLKKRDPSQSQHTTNKPKLILPHHRHQENHPVSAQPPQQDHDDSIENNYVALSDKKPTPTGPIGEPLKTANTNLVARSVLEEKCMPEAPAEMPDTCLSFQSPPAQKYQSEVNASSAVESQQLKQQLQLSNKKNTTLTSENEQLKNKEKLLQVQINNFSQDYYDRQIARLKSQAQGHQLKSIETQHKYDLMVSEKTELSLANQKKTEEIKGLMQKAEQERVETATLRGQLRDKEQLFQGVMGELERQNQSLAENVTQLTQRNQSIESQLRDSVVQSDSLKRQLEVAVGRSRETEKLCEGRMKGMGDRLGQREKQWVAKEQQYLQKQRQSEMLISRLSTDLERTQNEYRQSVRRQSEAACSRDESGIQKELMVVRQEEEIKELRKKVQDRENSIKQLSDKLKEQYSHEEYQKLEAKYKELEEKRLTSAKYYEKKLSALQKENDKMRMEKFNKQEQQIEPKPQESSGKGTTESGATFNELLKKHVSDSQSWKSEIHRISEQNSSLREELLDLKLKEKDHSAQTEILNKKIESLSKNCRIDMEVSEQKYVNEIDSLRRKLNTTETRLQYKTNESRQKDEFIKNSIVGRSRPEDVPQMVSELQRIFADRNKAKATQ